MLEPLIEIIDRMMRDKRAAARPRGATMSHLDCWRAEGEADLFQALCRIFNDNLEFASTFHDLLTAEKNLMKMRNLVISVDQSFATNGQTPSKIEADDVAIAIEWAGKAGIECAS